MSTVRNSRAYTADYLLLVVQMAGILVSWIHSFARNSQKPEYAESIPYLCYVANDTYTARQQAELDKIDISRFEQRLHAEKDLRIGRVLYPTVAFISFVQFINDMYGDNISQKRLTNLHRLDPVVCFTNFIIGSDPSEPSAACLAFIASYRLSPQEVANASLTTGHVTTIDEETAKRVKLFNDVIVRFLNI